MAEHTESPWTIGDRPETSNIVFGVDPVDGSPKTVAVVHGYTHEEVSANTRLIASAWTLPALKEALEAAIKELIAERDCFYEGSTNQHGEFDDPADEASLADLDRLIDQAMGALALTEGK